MGLVSKEAQEIRMHEVAVPDCLLWLACLSMPSWEAAEACGKLCRACWTKRSNWRRSTAMMMSPVRPELKDEREKNSSAVAARWLSRTGLGKCRQARNFRKSVGQLQERTNAQLPPSVADDLPPACRAEKCACSVCPRKQRRAVCLSLQGGRGLTMAAGNVLLDRRISRLICWM